MFKKYFVSILSIFVFSFIFANHSSAYVIPGSNGCGLKSTSVALTVVSEADLAGNIPLCVVAGNSLPVNVVVDGTPPTTIQTINTSGTSTFNYPKTFAVSDVGAGAKTITFIASDGTQTDQADMTFTITPALITLTATPSISQGATISSNTSETFTCTNSTEMYYDGVLVQSDYDGTWGYTLTHNITPTNGSHSVACHNIAATIQSLSPTVGSQYYPLLNFNVGGDMSGTLSAPDCTIAVGASNCSTTFSWSIQNKEGNTTAITASGVSDMLVSSSITPSSESGTRSATIYYGTRTYFLYNNAKSVAQVDVSGVCASGSSWDGSKCAAAIPQCPVGTPSGANAYPDCSCPSGTYQILPANVCAPCNAPNIYNATTHTCNAPGPIPYTHFLSFNVSGGYVPKGSKINLNWSIQKPNNTCNIVGVSLKDGSQVFNLLNYNAIVTPLLEAITNGSLLSVGDFTKLVGTGFQINQSTRFTASCIAPEGSPLPGYRQLVRDVYVTGEERN